MRVRAVVVFVIGFIAAATSLTAGAADAEAFPRPPGVEGTCVYFLNPYQPIFCAL